MSSAAAANKATPISRSHSLTSTQGNGVVVNPTIPVAGVEEWKRRAIADVISFRSLPANWDAEGSGPTSRMVTKAAIDLLLSIAGEGLAAPRIVPVSGGGVYFEWTNGPRELEATILPDERLELVRVLNGEPIDEEDTVDLAAVFGWLTAR